MGYLSLIACASALYLPLSKARKPNVIVWGLWSPPHLQVTVGMRWAQQWDPMNEEENILLTKSCSRDRLPQDADLCRAMERGDWSVDLLF